MTEEMKPGVFYFGEEKIIRVDDGYQPGIKRIVTEAGGSDVPEWEAAACIASEPKGLRDMQNARAIHIAGKILILLKELNSRVEDIGPILQKVVDSCRANEEKAIVKAFGLRPMDDKEVFEMKGEIRLDTWDKFLKL